MNNTRKTITVFDFDGTITTKDSFFHFINFASSPWKKISAAKLLAPVLLWKLSLFSRNEAKEKVFSHFFGDTNEGWWHRVTEEYSRIQLPKIINSKAINKMKQSQKMGHEIVIVSASLRDWIEPWARFNGVSRVIATEPEIKQKKLTGAFCVPNCVGDEKVRRFLDVYPGREDYRLNVYGNAGEDDPLLLFADNSFKDYF